ncbi:MAG: ABC transporter substrate-binding protein [Acidobacteriia bacterium]|nr:ABC transporter substrate-binding protein [Terriglobia bacterium]
MKRTGFPLLVASSLLLATLASSATRPHYGGTLHAAVQAAPSSLDPNQPDHFGSRNIFGLIFDTLVVLDDQGRPEPALAASWQAEPGDQRWQFSLRHGVSFQDGTPLTADSVATSLRAVNPSWKVLAAGDTVVIERDAPAPDLPAELALPRNGIVKRESGKTAGTGPFVMSQWEPAKRLTLVARDDYWGGRPFLGSIDIVMGQSLRDQMIAFDLGRAQLIEVAPEQARRAATEGRRIEGSAPAELIALVFARPPQSAEEAKLREALSLSIDRGLLNTVVLQNGGEPAGGLLPNWMTGYGFLFPVEVNMTRAQQERAEVPKAVLWGLDYDRNDALERVLAERIMLSARDAGLRVQLASGASADAKLVRVPLAASDAHIALGEIAKSLGLPQPVFHSSAVDDLYVAESTLLHSQRVIPLLHLRTAWAVSNTVKNWSEGHDGSWRLVNTWLTTERP